MRIQRQGDSKVRIIHNIIFYVLVLSYRWMSSWNWHSRRMVDVLGGGS